MKSLAILLLAIGLASCAAPKAIVIAEAPKKKETTANSAPQPQQASLPPDDGMRLPDDLLALPEDNELRSAATEPKDGNATVIARPPKD